MKQGNMNEREGKNTSFEYQIKLYNVVFGKIFENEAWKSRKEEKNVLGLHRQPLMLNILKA